MRKLLKSRYGRLTPIALFEQPGSERQVRILCVCDCGTVRDFMRCNLGRSARSCGCSKIKHGLSRTSEYNTWRLMIQRVTNPRDPDWHRYGGRGIGICAEWRSSFQSFIAYVGRRPSPDHSIDRFPNPDGNYEPGNVRWATPAQQALNHGSGCHKTGPKPRRRN